MQTTAASSTDGTWLARIMIIDDHEISRAACSALLRAEGLDITDLPASDRALTDARSLRPDAAIVDVTPTADTGFAMAHALRALPAPPIVILTSSANRTQFGTRLNGYRFIAKADICTAAIAHQMRQQRQCRPRTARWQIPRRTILMAIPDCPGRPARPAPIRPEKEGP